MTEIRGNESGVICSILHAHVGVKARCKIDAAHFEKHAEQLVRLRRIRLSVFLVAGFSFLFNLDVSERFIETGQNCDLL